MYQSSQLGIPKHVRYSSVRERIRCARLVQSLHKRNERCCLHLACITTNSSNLLCAAAAVCCAEQQQQTDVKNKCEDGTICPANTAGCKDNACYCEEGYKLMPDGQCIGESHFAVYTHMHTYMHAATA
jgi:hypothetical protein